MTRRFQTLRGFLVAITLAGSSVPVSAPGAHTAPPAAKTAKPATWAVPRTPDGRPDIQGTWTYATLTPLERPDGLGDKRVLSEQEAAEFERTELVRRDEDSREGHGTDADVARAYNQF